MLIPGICLQQYLKVFMHFPFYYALAFLLPCFSSSLLSFPLPLLPFLLSFFFLFYLTLQSHICIACVSRPFGHASYLVCRTFNLEHIIFPSFWYVIILRLFLWVIQRFCQLHKNLKQYGFTSLLISDFLDYIVYLHVLIPSSNSLIITVITSLFLQE